MSQDIFIPMREMITFAQFQQAIQQVQASAADITVQSPSEGDDETSLIRIEQRKAFIATSLEVRPPYYSEYPEDAGILFYQIGLSLTPEEATYIHTILGGPIQSIVGIIIFARDGSERLAMQLVEALAAYGPLIVDMNWSLQTNYFTLAEIQPFMTPDELNPIGQLSQHCKSAGYTSTHP